VAVAAIAIVAIYMSATTGQFEKGRKRAEDRRDDGELGTPEDDPVKLDASAHEVDASARKDSEPEGAPRQRRPEHALQEDREIEQDRQREVAAERDSHRL
jgi:hypothetical protein